MGRRSGEWVEEVVPARFDDTPVITWIGVCVLRYRWKY